MVINPLFLCFSIPFPTRQPCDEDEQPPTNPLLSSFVVKICKNTGVAPLQTNRQRGVTTQCPPEEKPLFYHKGTLSQKLTFTPNR